MSARISAAWFWLSHLMRRRDWWLPTAALVAFTVGLAVRIRHLYVLHPPRFGYVGDSSAFFDLASKISLGTQQGPGDTVWSPGTAATLALAGAVDPWLRSLDLPILVTCCLSPVLVADSARRVIGSRAGWLALLFASLHVEWTRHAAFLQSDFPYIACVVVAVWCACVAATSPGRWGRMTSLLATGAWAGLAWHYRGPIFPGLVVCALALPLFGRRARRQWRWWLIAAVPFAGALFGPVRRCAALTGQFCMGAVNGVMHVAIGHAGEVKGLQFLADEYGPTVFGTPPVLRDMHRYTPLVDVPASAYNTMGVLRWVGGRFTTDPIGVVLDSLRSLIDLVALDVPWPSVDGTVLDTRAMYVANAAFLLFVVAPAVYEIWRDLKLAVRGRIRPSLVLSLPVVALIVVAVLTVGAPRYRLPWDGALMALAARFYVGDHHDVPSSPVWERVVTRTTQFAVGCSLLLAVGATAALNFLVMPGWGAVQVAWLAELPQMAPPVTHVTELSPQVFRVREPDGHGWNGPGTQVLKCRRNGCDEARADFPGLRQGARLAIGVDGNDRYQVTFWHGDQRLSSVHFGRGTTISHPGTGIRTHLVAVPVPNADGISITPVNGDGFYSVAFIVEQGSGR